MFNVRCRKCQTLLKAPDGAAGKRVKCAKCGLKFTLPVAASPSSPPRSLSSRSTIVIAVIAVSGIFGLTVLALTAVLIWNAASHSGPQRAMAAERKSDSIEPPSSKAEPQLSSQSSKAEPSRSSQATATPVSAPRVVSANADLAQRRSRLVDEHNAAANEYNAIPEAPADFELQHDEDLLELDIKTEEIKIRGEMSQKTSDLALKNNLSSAEYESRKGKIEEDAETALSNRKRELRKKYQEKLDRIVANQQKKADLAIKIAKLRAEVQTIDRQMGAKSEK